MPEGVSFVSSGVSGGNRVVFFSFDWLKNNSCLRGFLHVKEREEGSYDFSLVIENVDGFRSIESVSCLQRNLTVGAEKLTQFNLPLLLKHIYKTPEFSRLSH